MRRRGIENMLLRRVRRHQSMTALFRAPSSEKVTQLQTRLVDQKEEQGTIVSPQTEIASLSIPMTPPRSDTVARQVVPSSTSTSKPLPPVPATPASNEPSKPADPVWKR